MGEMVDGADGADGGCILVDSGVTATFSQLSVNNCQTQQGGNGAQPSASDTPGGNAGRGGDGAGIANFGTLTVEKSFVSQNDAGDGGSPGAGTAGTGQAVAGGNGGVGGSGGGIYNEGTLTVRESTVHANAGGDPSAGAAGTNGGARGEEGEGGAGGGIATVNGGTTTLSGSIVALNDAGDDTNNDGTGPSATKQPGSDLYDGSVADSDENTGPNPFETGTFTDGGYNLIGSNNSVDGTFADVAMGTMVDNNNNIVGSGQGDAATRVDPLITGSNQEADYDVLAYELASGSPAIDAGDPALMMTIDGRGAVRPDSTDGSVSTADIGAFEFGSGAAPEMLVINELDFVTAPSSEEDAAEFVEIKNTGIYQAQLADYALVFFSGEDDTSYLSLNLQGALEPGETFTIGDEAMMGMDSMFDQAALMGASDQIRDEDGAVGLYNGKASDYPTGAVAGANAGTRRDVVVYDNGMQPSLTGGPGAARDAGSLASAFGQSEDEIVSGDTNDSSIQRNEDGTFSAGPPSPGDDTAAQNAPMNVVINEVDSDQTSTDAAEFIELTDGGRGNTALDGLAVVLFNGSNDSVYRTIDLDGQTTGPDGFFVIGNPGVVNVDLEIAPGANGFLQNGVDAVALYAGDDETGQLLDVVVYGTTDDLDQDFVDAFDRSGIESRAAAVQYEEDFNGEKDTESIQRINDATTTDGYSLLFYAAAPTPGEVNVGTLTVDKTDEVADTEGWRLLSSPVIDAGLYGAAGTPLRVDFYAENVNLVQGVAAGTPASLYQAQFPSAGDNLFDRYLADGTYRPAAETDDALAPGAGFFWYWYDRDIMPTDGGDSRSYDLSNPDFSFAVTGLPIDDRVTMSTGGTMQPVQLDLLVGQDGFVMLGNPYAYPYSVDAVSTSAGMLSDVFNAYDPADGTYDQITANATAAPSAANTAPVWQGVSAEVSGQAGNTVTFTAPSSGVVPTLETLQGDFRVAAQDEARVALALSGTTDGGAAVTDRAASVRFLDTATDGWDRHDGSKLDAIAATYALIAPVGTRDGAAYRQGALSLPAGDAEVTVPLAFSASEAGTYTVEAQETAGYAVRLTDLETGATADLTTGAYTFDAQAADWTDRFALTLRAPLVDAEDGADARDLVAGPFPNPATARARFTIEVERSQTVQVEVFDALGRRVATLHDGELAAGEARRLSLDVSRLAVGAYVVRARTGDRVETRRLTVVR